MPVRRKLAVVGDGLCGKTCLLATFSRDQFPTVYIPPVLETSVTDMKVDGKDVELSLWDTAGLEDFDTLRPFSYRDSDIVLIVFSIDSRDSFGNVVEKWNPEVSQFCKKGTKILVGTKKDLRDGGEKNEELISFKEGKKMAKKINAYCYMECSAKLRDGVQELFEKAVKAVLKPKKDNLYDCAPCRLM